MFQDFFVLSWILIELAHTLIVLAHTLILLTHTLIALALTHLNSTEKLHRLDWTPSYQTLVVPNIFFVLNSKSYDKLRNYIGLTKKIMYVWEAVIN